MLIFRILLADAGVGDNFDHGYPDAIVLVMDHLFVRE